MNVYITTVECCYMVYEKAIESVYVEIQFCQMIFYFYLIETRDGLFDALRVSASAQESSFLVLFNLSW